MGNARARETMRMLIEPGGRWITGRTLVRQLSSRFLGNGE
jgi:hypothetical protein